MASQGVLAIFSKLEKFDGRSDVDLSSWLRAFDRCCTIAQKDDDLVQGQLLMVCLDGQALAVAEQLEEEKKAQQKYSEIKVRLEAVFKTTATKEAKMVAFENRIQRLEESEDEFMLSLVKLYRAADPDATDANATKAIKRRFMGGIANEVRQSIYIFCNDPYAATVSYQKLLEHARNAKIHALDKKPDKHFVNVLNTSNVTDSNTNDYLLKAISDLSDNMNRRIDDLETNYNSLQGINAISRGRGNNHRGNYRGNRN